MQEFNQNFQLILPVPDSKLKLGSNQTKGVNKYAVARTRKQAREWGYYLAIHELNINNLIFNTKDKLLLEIDVHFKSNVHMDDDNILTSLKSYRDGIFDALKTKFKVNDKQIKRTILNTDSIDKENPRLKWRLSILS